MPEESRATGARATKNDAAENDAAENDAAKSDAAKSDAAENDTTETRATKPPRPFGFWLVVGLLVAVLDQILKFVVLSRFAEGEQYVVIPGLFNLTLWYNRGAAFSFLAHHDGWQRWFFIASAIFATIFICWLLRRYWQHTLFASGLALVLGGALGNLVDRVRIGKVVDYLLFYQGNWAFPAFNLADSALTLGAALLILDEIRRIRANPKENAVDQRQ